MAETYDTIGVDYAQHRHADRRIARAIAGALDGADRIVNVGAGAGSYEPADRCVVAVEPAITMIRQRPEGAGPAIRARAEALPFRDRSFDAALAVLTIHHWSDWRAGLREMLRVSRDRVVLLTWDPESGGFWLTDDYLPDLLVADSRHFPTMAALREALGAIQVDRVPIPWDCTDGFMGAYWRRPHAYLDPQVRGSTPRVDHSRSGATARSARAATYPGSRCHSGTTCNGTWGARRAASRQKAFSELPVVAVAYCG